jgi:altronate hydrolase
VQDDANYSEERIVMTQLGVDPFFRADQSDNVAVALRAVAAGTVLDGVTVEQPVPAGHKVTVAAIRAGEPIRKGGTAIGVAAADLAPGQLVAAQHIRLDPALPIALPASAGGVEVLPEARRATFQGFVRPDGRVGTRNTIGVFVVGNCGATAARKAADHFDAERLAAYPNVDAVVPYVHEIGCGMEMTGEPMDLLRRTISGTIRNPNTAAAVVIALGCERNNLRGFLEQEKLEVGPRLHTITIQDIGGIKNAVAEAIRLIETMLPEVNKAQRQTVGAEHLTLGLKSGASDGLTGLSANPALGAAVDLLVRHGGTAIMAETPELLPLEPAVAARAATPEVGEKLAERLAWWRQYNAGKDTQATGRLSRGEEAAGLANLLEKGLGGTRKAGTTPLKDVYRYAEPVRERGLVFMDTPGYDPVSVTGQIAGGANLIAFTTGQGSTFGSLPAPTVKLAASSDLYRRMEEDMDIDCGPVLEGISAEEMGRRIFERLLRHASGEKTKSEIDGMGENEFVPWPIGVLA